MGWGLVSASRAKLFGNCTAAKDPAKTDFKVYDMCSESRRMACGSTPRSAYIVGNSLCRGAWKVTRKCLVMLFDDNAKMHPVRSELHSVRYKPLSAEAIERGISAGKVVCGGQLYAPSMVPYTEAETDQFDVESKLAWGRMWPTSHGKAKAFELIRRACILWHHANAKAGQQMVLWHTGPPLTYPYDCADCKRIGSAITQNNFGEADFKVSEAVQILAIEGSVMIQTIDTDMILQMLASKHIHPKSQVWVRLLNETLSIHAMVSEFGGSDRDARLSSTFWLLCCNGVDYCKGLTRFGFSTAGMMLLAQESARVVTHSPGANTATLNTSAMLQHLAAIKMRRSRNQTFIDFSDELHRIMFCLSLFTGAQKMREPYGGPDRTSGYLFAGAPDTFLCTEAVHLDTACCSNICIAIDE